MTHSFIISHLYLNFTHYRELWEQEWEQSQEFGAFVFLPGKELDWEWWTLLEIRRYIQEGGLDDEEMLEGIYDFEFGEEFLVLVIEYVRGPEKQEAYFHRMSKVRMN
jgi:hypothetical protein